MATGTAPTRGNTLRSIGMSLLFFGMAIAGIARSLHASDAVQIGASIVSGLMSVTALALFIKAADTNRQRLVVLTCVAILALTAVLVVVVLLR